MLFVDVERAWDEREVEGLLFWDLDEGRNGTRNERYCCTLGM